MYSVVGPSVVEGAGNRAEGLDVSGIAQSSANILCAHCVTELPIPSIDR